MPWFSYESSTYYITSSPFWQFLTPHHPPHCHQFRHFENPLSPYGDDVICEWYHIEDSLVGHSLAQLSRHLNIASKLCATGIRAQKLIREKEILSNAHRYMHSTYIILCIQYIIDRARTIVKYDRIVDTLSQFNVGYRILSVGQSVSN